MKLESFQHDLKKVFQHNTAIAVGHCFEKQTFSAPHTCWQGSAAVVPALSGLYLGCTPGIQREAATVLPNQHFVTITLVDQAATDEGAENVLRTAVRILLTSNGVPNSQYNEGLGYFAC